MSKRAANVSRWLIAAAALFALGLALSNLRASTNNLTVETMSAEGTPVSVFRPAAGGPTPVVIIAHGFAGSQQLMRSFALTLAHHGYVAVTFDFAGHGRNPTPLRGSITREDGATRTLVAETARVAALARPLGDGRLAVLGHSMATDIVVRFAEETHDVAATVAVSMFSPAVTATSPRNLLVIVGDWETGLKTEALRAANLVSAPRAAQPGVTYGDVTTGSARRVAFSPGTEHVSVLYSATSLQEAVAWLDATFGKSADRSSEVQSQGPSILLLLFGVVALGYPLSHLLPVVAEHPTGAGLPWARLWFPLIAPAVLTPLILHLLPTHFLPILVGDYLAARFAAYGLITAACFAVVGHELYRARATAWPRLLVGAAGMITFGFVALAWPIDTYVTSFVPTGSRAVLVLAMLAGTIPYFLSDEWLTRGEGSGRGAFFASKVAFIVSLAVAVVLDFEALFFLLIIVPVIVVFFLVYGLFSTWAYRRSGHPFVAGLGNAVAFAWAIAVTFPLLAG